MMLVQGLVQEHLRANHVGERAAGVQGAVAAVRLPERSRCLVVRAHRFLWHSSSRIIWHSTYVGLSSSRADGLGHAVLRSLLARSQCIACARLKLLLPASMEPLTC